MKRFDLAQELYKAITTLVGSKSIDETHQKLLGLAQLATEHLENPGDWLAWDGPEYYFSLERNGFAAWRDEYETTCWPVILVRASEKSGSFTIFYTANLDAGIPESGDIHLGFSNTTLAGLTPGMSIWDGSDALFPAGEAIYDHLVDKGNPLPEKLHGVVLKALKVLEQEYGCDPPETIS